jgi:hypothetical protein
MGSVREGREGLSVNRPYARSAKPQTLPTLPDTLAGRVMKARRASACSACCAPIRVGDQIAQVGRRWLHAGHLTGQARQRTLDALSAALVAADQTAQGGDGTSQSSDNGRPGLRAGRPDNHDKQRKA